MLKTSGGVVVKELLLFFFSLGDSECFLAAQIHQVQVQFLDEAPFVFFDFGVCSAWFDFSDPCFCIF